MIRQGKFPMLTGASPLMNAVFELIGKVANSDTTVMIYGESGTGKERVAKTIHQASARITKPFVPVNCAAIPDTLLESELFGHEKGAFTGAVNMRMGRFELANGGTIFLDEIGELHPSLQVKLLRVLQEREFERVGGTKTIQVDVRILAATNRDLEKATRDGTFREDLYYRLNVIPIHMPPLRQRREDVPLLIEDFVGAFAKKKNKSITLSPDTMAMLLSYPWPGNVRELENMIERIVILNDSGTIGKEELPEKIRGGAPMQAGAHAANMSGSLAEPVLPEGGIDINAVLDEMERNLIVQAMKRTAGVKSKAAALLGLNRTTLIEKIKKKGIDFGDRDANG